MKFYIYFLYFPTILKMKRFDEQVLSYIERKYKYDSKKKN